MPHHKAEKKSLKQSEKKRAENKKNKNFLKKNIKAFKITVANSPSDAMGQLSHINSIMARFSKHNNTKKKTMARRISRLHTMVKKALQ